LRLNSAVSASGYRERTHHAASIHLKKLQKSEIDAP
jgi:hypothetical protein